MRFIKSCQEKFISSVFNFSRNCHVNHTIKSFFACFSLQENQPEVKQKVTHCLCREVVLKISNNKRSLLESVDAYCVQVTKIFEQ